MPALDKELTGLAKAAKTKPKNFVFVSGGDAKVLKLGKKPIPPKVISAAKEESGGSIVFRGRCLYEAGEFVFEVDKNPPADLAKKIKEALKERAGLKLPVVVRQVAEITEVVDDSSDDEGGEVEGTETPGAPEAAEPSPELVAARATYRDVYKRALALLNDLMKSKSPSAKDLFERAQAADPGLGKVEAGLAPEVVRDQIARYEQATATIQEIEALARSALRAATDAAAAGGTAIDGTPEGDDRQKALAIWKAEKSKAVALVRKLQAEVLKRKEEDPDSVEAIRMLDAIPKTLAAEPADVEEIDRLEAFLADEIIDAAEAENPFGFVVSIREPLSRALAEVRRQSAT